MRKLVLAPAIVLFLSSAAVAVAGDAGVSQIVVELPDLDYLKSTEVALQAADDMPDSDLPTKRAARFNALQMLASARANVGDHAGATRAFAESFYAYRATPLPKPADTTPADLEYARSVLASHRPEAAVAAIVRAAKDRRIVILNESHQLSRHRAFGMEVALALRKLGFRYLAMETLETGTEKLAKRGYPLRSDGWYSKDPLFGDFIRQSLRAGYIPVAYEQTAEQEPGTQDWDARIDAREENQANNLIERVLKRDPDARIFMYVGYSHVLKGSEIENGKPQTWMAERLRAKTGIDPLCIEQTKITEPLPGTRDRALIDAMFAETSEDSVVLAKMDAPEVYYAFDPVRVDMQVFHRPARLVNGRADWLALGGYRKPRPIPAKLLPKSGRRLAQAFVADESADAVPIDQVLVTAGEPPPVFMLPKGKFRFAFQD